VAWREDAAGNRTTYTYSAVDGRLVAETNPLSQSTYFAYNPRGQLIRQWGPATYPVEYAYNDYGEKIAMRTFRNPSQNFTTATWPLTDGGSSPGNPDPSAWTVGLGDKTTWTYQASTGLLTAKADALGRSVAYTYTMRGQLDTRTWARGVVTTYTYSSLTGEQTSISYSDSTPALTYTYTRLGQLDTVRDATSASATDLRDFVYDPAYPLRLSCEAFNSFYGSRVLTRLMDATTTSTTLKGRDRGFQLGSGVGSNTDLEQTYGYSTVGRFDTLATKRTSNAATRTFHYGYETNSPLLKTLWTDDNSFFVTRSFEGNRNVLTVLDAKWGQTASTSLARYAYHSDGVGRRDTLVQTGDAFAGLGYSGSTNAINQTFTYNTRSEVTAAPTALGDNPASPGTALSNRQHEYDFDSIGNRNWAGVTGYSSDRKSYTANALNQYSSRQNSTTPFTGTQSFTYDDDGNVLTDGRWVYTWDAENRLIAMTTEPLVIGAGVSATDARQLEFVYTT
jgi:YD repeat-containing protein